MSLELFKYPTPVIDNGPQGSYDKGFPGKPVVHVRDDLYKMWYEATKHPRYDAATAGP